jgi:hypothetical protein
LAQPHEARELVGDHVVQKGIKTPSRPIIQPISYDGINLPFGGDQHLRAKPLYGADPWQDDLGLTTLGDQTFRKVEIGRGMEGLIQKPLSEFCRTATGKTFEAIEVTQLGQMIVARFLSCGVSGQITRLYPDLGGQEPLYLDGDGLARCKQPP